MKITREIFQIKMICTTTLFIFSIYSLSLIYLRRSYDSIFMIITNVSIYIFIYLNLIDILVISSSTGNLHICIKRSLIPRDNHNLQQILHPNN